MLAVLSLFPGGWTVDAVETVCPPRGYEILETLARLLDKNFIQTGDHGRFSMLHVVRQYMLERRETRDDAAECRARFKSWGLATLREHYMNVLKDGAVT